MHSFHYLEPVFCSMSSSNCCFLTCIQSSQEAGGLVFPCLEEFCTVYCWASPVAQTVKHLPTMRETRVQFLGQKDLLEKEMATCSSILAWKIPWMEEPGRLQSMGSHRVGHNWLTSHTLWSTVKGFGIVNKSEIEGILGNLLLFRRSSRCWQFDIWFLCLF